jgi:hypothetical protein
LPVDASVLKGSRWSAISGLSFLFKTRWSTFLWPYAFVVSGPAFSGDAAKRVCMPETDERSRRLAKLPEVFQEFVFGRLRCPGGADTSPFVP